MSQRGYLNYFKSIKQLFTGTGKDIHVHGCNMMFIITKMDILLFFWFRSLWLAEN